MVGIGGIGMSALAQLYASQDISVSGSDRDESPTIELLKKKGIAVFIGHDAKHVPDDVELLVYSDAVPGSNPERLRTRELGIRQISYFEALGEAAVSKKTIAVSGTHGKTTTTAMLAKILSDAGKEPTAIIGSIVHDFDSNFVSGKSEIFVVEACEYRNHLLELSPEVLVITNLEWDHTDFFPSLSALQETFQKAVMKVSKTGTIITDLNNPNVRPVLQSAQAKIIDYTKEEVPELSLIGEFNKMNARAAKAAARAVAPDISEQAIDQSLISFKGTWRRFEAKGITKEGALVFDDYAHHPGAVKATLSAVREKFPNKKIVVAFHPHLYSRTRDLMEEFADAFLGASKVFVAPIYPAREDPIPGVTSEVLAEKITAHGVSAEALPDFRTIRDRLQSLATPDTIIITMGAGDIYQVGESLIQL